MIRSSPILINEGNVASGILEKERDVLENGAIWHKVFIRNAIQYERDYVLRILMDAVDPYDFIPVKYTIEGDNVSFLIKNCNKAIHEFCKRNLTIPNPTSVSYPFKLAILLRYVTNVQIDVQSSIMRVLQKRYNGKNRCMNLTAFHKDPDLIEFCPLSQPKLLYFVLHLSKGYEYTSIKLCNNDIEFLKPFEALSSMRSLVSVDLRKNKVKSFYELFVLHQWPITEVFLDDNPVCADCIESTYIKEVRRHCTKLQKLDGFIIPPQTIFLCSYRQNFLCNKSGFDLVEQFVEHYFSMYDSPARALLESMYTKTTCFTVTANYLSGCHSFSHAKLGPYINVSHNINKCADMSKSVESVHIGAKAIATILTKLPNTEHDPHTFTVDLLFYSENTAVICVTGVFREPADSLLEVDRMIGFARTFVLMSVGSNAGFTDEFVIVNETFSVNNATASQEARAFQSGPCEVFKDSRFLHQQHVEVTPARTQNDETQFIDALMKIAGLNSKWANKCLEEANFDLQKALTLFVELYKVDKIPDAAFLTEDEITKLTMAGPAKVTRARSLSPTEVPQNMSQSNLYMPLNIVDDRANPYSNDPFDTSRPYQGNDRRNRWPCRESDRELEREKEQERERIREREKEIERERIRERDHEIELIRDRERIRERELESKRELDREAGRLRDRQVNRPNSPGKWSNSTTNLSRIGGAVMDPLGGSVQRSWSRSNDSVQVIETIDLDAQEDRLMKESLSKRMSGPDMKPVPAPVPVSTSLPKSAGEQAPVKISVPKLHPVAAHNNEISMNELTEYENQLTNIKGHPNQQQKAIQELMNKLFTQYPMDVKVWLLSIGTHYKRQMPQKAREMKNRAMKLFALAPQLGFQIKLAAAQMEMEYVTGPAFSAGDKKVGEQNFLQIIHHTPNNLNIAKMYVTCLIKRYAANEQQAWDLFQQAISKNNLKLPGGPRDFFDHCKASIMQG